MFRFWQIFSLPGGLFPDEAANGLDINSIFRGHLAPFYERGNGREALFFYVLAVSVGLFGRGPWQHHIVSAGFGIAEIIVAYLLTKRLFGKNVALLTAFFMTVSSYATTLSRTAFRATTVPLFTTLTLLFLVKFFQTRDPRTKFWATLGAGTSFGLGFYTYISFRMMVPLLIGLFCLLLFGNRGKIKKLFSDYFRYLLFLLGGFLATFSWLGYYFLNHSGTFIGRAGQVSVFSKDLNHGDVWGTFLSVIKKTLLSFFTEGDLNWRHNVSGFPFLSPMLSPFFALSLLIFTCAAIPLLKQVWQKKIQAATFYKVMIAGWFWLMLIPEITTAEGIPHGLRLSGIIPAIFILPAWSVSELWARIKKSKFLAPGRVAYALIFLSAIFVYNFFLYFGVSANSPEYYYAFRSDLTNVSNYLNERDLKSQTYLSLDKFSVQTVDYLTTRADNPYILLEPAQTYEVKLSSGDQVIFTQSTLFDRIKFRQFHPETKLVKIEKNKFGEIVMLVYGK